jgi:carbonic anhydrase
LLEDLRRRGCAVAILHAGHAVPEALAPVDAEGYWASRLVPSDADAQRLLGSIIAVAPFERLVEGVERFRKIAKERYRGLFEELASGQSPHTLFITCSDSRVSPLLVTGAEPGELFVHRNVGNIVPRSGADAMPAEGAAVEYALGVLGVKQIVVCGHSGCGAMNAIRSGAISPDLPSVAKWLEDARGVLERVPAGASADAIAKMNVLVQLEHLRTYPIVQRKIASGEVTLHAWYYEIGRADIQAWDAELGAYAPLSRDRLVAAVEEEKKAVASAS